MAVLIILESSNIYFTRSHYEDMVKFNPEFAPMLEGCLANRTKWVEIEEGKEDKNSSESSVRVGSGKQKR